jgi:hypothetical protein
MTKKTAAGDWCVTCRHCITWDRQARRWIHVSTDDWSGGSCSCVNAMLPCRVPESRLKIPRPELKRSCGPGTLFAPGIARYVDGNTRKQEE